MTKKEEILNNTTGLEDDYGHESYSRGLVEDMMEKYGKYCAVIAFDDGFYMGYIDNQRPDFDEWWSEFQRKEEAK